MKLKRIHIVPIIGCLIVAQASFAQIRLPRLFSDHMIFQRDQPIKVWGWAAPGEIVQVAFADQIGQSKTRGDSTWEVFLPAMSAGGPFQMKVSGESTIAVKDVWIGDVWIAGGQSNMEWKLSWTVDNWEAEVADSEFPQIRFFDVPNVFSPELKDDVSDGEWVVANPKTSGEFSAVAWFFAKQNHLEKGVPVGIIESNWGGTPAEAWTKVETLASAEGYEQKVKEVQSPQVPWVEFIQQNKIKEKQKWDLIGDEEGAKATGAQNLAFVDSDWQSIQLPNVEPMTDMAWVRKEFTLDKPVKSFRFFIGNIVQNAMVFCNGELIWKRTWNNDSEILTIQPELLKVGKNVLAIRVANDWDNRAYVGRNGEMWMEVDGVKTSLEGVWKYSNDMEPKMPEVTNISWTPGFLYNAMIHPIAGYAARGVIWYQGESNVGECQYYHQLFTHMIRDWRKAWDNPDLTFLYVQLANYLERKEEPAESAWAQLRDAQTQTLALSKTGMATIIDIGDAEDIHPRNKKDVGERLWLAARKVSYGDELEYSGPTYQSHRVKKNKVIVSFEHAKNGFVVKNNETPVGFAVAGIDQKFYWATAQIKGNEIILCAPEVKSPVAVRYAWADNPATNLYNKEGLPAVPFRTDDW